MNHPDRTHWFFGNNTGIDFSSGSPVAIYGSGMVNYRGSAVVSDREGNLLFYTSGNFVWNKHHEPMLNGDLSDSNNYGWRPAIIVPKPCSDHYYIVTTTDANIINKKLHYTEVDPSLDGGSGAVTSVKNIPIGDSIGRGIVAIRPLGQTDIWIVCRQINSDIFLAWRVTAEGIHPFPVVSHAGSIIDETGSILKASPEGDKIISMNAGNSPAEHSIDLLKFNGYNGTVSTICGIPMPFPYYPYGAEFSPNASKLYISSWLSAEIWQYDLTLATDTVAFVASAIPVAPAQPTGFEYGDLQLAPDGRIYFPYRTTSYLGCIANPDELGAGCGFVENAIDFEDNTLIYAGLPIFMQGDMFLLCPGAVPNVITPNGDGTNDVLAIENIPNGEGSLTVYNRWGTVVFSAESYNNDWDGKGLTDGVYFYLYRYNEGSEYVSGHIEIIR